MTAITLESLEPELTQRLLQRANDNGRTVEAEIADILSNALASEKQEETSKNTEEKEVGLATAIRARFAPVGGFEMPEIPKEPVRTPPSF